MFPDGLFPPKMFSPSLFPRNQLAPEVPPPPPLPTWLTGTSGSAGGYLTPQQWGPAVDVDAARVAARRKRRDVLAVIAILGDDEG